MAPTITIITIFRVRHCLFILKICFFFFCRSHTIIAPWIYTPRRRAKSGLNQNHVNHAPAKENRIRVKRHIFTALFRRQNRIHAERPFSAFGTTRAFHPWPYVSAVYNGCIQCVVPTAPRNSPTPYIFVHRIVVKYYHARQYGVMGFWNFKHSEPNVFVCTFYYYF